MTSEIKTFIKRILGRKNLRSIKTIRQYIKYVLDLAAGNYGHIKCAYGYQTYSLPQKHVFFGYYDLQQIDKSGDKLLVHILAKDAVAGETPIIIGYIDRKKGIIKEVAYSNAWSWQQGSRLRWSNSDDERIYFNNYDDDGYCCELWSISREKIRRFSWPFYDISSDESFGLSLNFSRLQRLRPGYGYSNMADNTSAESFPADDGIFYIDLKTNESRLLVSLKDLAEENGVETQYQGYINHISISPDSKRFIFFFLWAENDYLPWKNCLYSYDFEKEKLSLIEDQITVSHYCWISDTDIYITSIRGDYYKYNVIKETRTKLNNKHLCHDGHPSFMKNNQILTDTYPLAHNYQHVFTTDEEGKDQTDILEVYSDPRLFEDKRCDTHPRISGDLKYITVDSSYIDKKRSVIEIEIS